MRFCPFDAPFYRASYPELALPNDEAALRHYDERGRDEGRLGSPQARREGLVAGLDPDRPTLEIGQTGRIGTRAASNSANGLSKRSQATRCLWTLSHTSLRRLLNVKLTVQ